MWRYSDIMELYTDLVFDSFCGSGVRVNYQGEWEDSDDIKADGSPAPFSNHCSKQVKVKLNFLF